MVQAGLVKNDSLVRKRSLYLLQRVVEMCQEQRLLVNVCLDRQSTPVFWWNIHSVEKLLDIWQQYVFLLETLEEKQVNTIQFNNSSPLFPLVSGFKIQQLLDIYFIISFM